MLQIASSRRSSSNSIRLEDRRSGSLKVLARSVSIQDHLRLTATTTRIAQAVPTRPNGAGPNQANQEANTMCVSRTKYRKNIVRNVVPAVGATINTNQPSTRLNKRPKGSRGLSSLLSSPTEELIRPKFNMRENIMNTANPVNSPTTMACPTHSGTTKWPYSCCPA